MDAKSVELGKKFCLIIVILITLSMVFFLIYSENFYRTDKLLNNSEVEEKNQVLVTEYESLKLDYTSENKNLMDEKNSENIIEDNVGKK